MAINGIAQLQLVRKESNIDKEAAASEQADRATKQYLKKVDQSFKESVKEAHETHDAATTSAFGRLFGTIIGGPVVGTLIGGAIGDAANNGSEDAAREAKKKAGMLDVDAEQKFDSVSDARKLQDDARSESAGVQKFGDELRSARFTGLV